MTPDTPLRELDDIGPQRSRQLAKLGLSTVRDLVLHYPRRYEDRRQFDRFPTAESETPVCVCGTVARTASKRLRGWQKMFELTLEEENPNALSPTLTCRWFNMHYVQKMVATGMRIVVFGKPRRRGRTICIDHPEFEVVEDDDATSLHLRRITPIHRTTAGISTRLLRSLLGGMLAELPPWEDLIPRELDDLPTHNALHWIHFPEDWEQLERARKHLILAEFFAMQLVVAGKRAETVARPGANHCGPGTLTARLHRSLPFALTDAQHRAIGEIRHDLALGRPMNRLLHGDVGSGKTFVAMSAMLLAVEAGYQAALMAPTQILAEQHYLTFRRWLEPLGIRLALRTGSRKEETALPLFDAAARGLGSAPVPGAGEGVPPSRTSPVAAQYRQRRRLPHFEKPWLIYAVTIPTAKDRSLSPEARTLALDALRHFHGSRYELFAACVMPDHIHALLQPWPKGDGPNGNVEFWQLSTLLGSVKSFSAKAINKLEGCSGAVWEKESFDRYIRSDSDLEEKFHYIVRNPWSAEVVRADEDYPWVWTSDQDSESPSRRDAATSTRDESATRIPAGDPEIIIGTHALLHDGIEYSNLGLAVIDEQHKFGVMQRARLMDQTTAPDVLVMTATPIPRTLTMTVYGDLDVSTLDELPANRGKVVTAVRDESKLPDAVKFLREHLEKGRQAYIVYPLIDESGKLEAKAAAKEYEAWSERLKPLSCELLHGRIEADEKDAVMQRFRTGETRVLVATSVIEVGIDVPNANIMLVENAERFGLAQLHQLRGRIGRGAHKSYCILITSAGSPDAMAKLKTLEESSNGFAIAEADLQLRGPGDILGTAQSGLPPLRLGNLLTDASLMQTARDTVTRIFSEDPRLESPENDHYRKVIEETKRLVLSQVS